MKTLLTGLLSSLLILHTAAGHATVALDFAGLGQLEDQCCSNTLGWRFTVKQPITVTHLGLFDVGQNGLVDSHKVGIWADDGRLLVQTTVGGSAMLVGKFRYVSIPPTTLQTGTYRIGALYISGSQDTRLTEVIGLTTDTQIGYLNPHYSAGEDLSFPDVNPGPINGYFGPNFQFSVSPDLVAVSLAWNNTTGGVDARYSVDGGALTTATTAKLFWANGTSTANILPGTPPISSKTIPAGTGGPGSSGVITFNVPGPSFGTPPPGATHLLLVVDFVPGENMENNSVALGPGSVVDFPDYSGPTGSDSLNDADATLADRINALLQARPKGSTYKITSVYRPYPYQVHFVQIRDTYVNLLKVPGIVPDPILIGTDGKGKVYRPRLKLTAGTPSMLCKAVMDHVNKECQDHLLRAVPKRKFAPGVNNAQNSLHTVNPSQAVDVHVYRNNTEITGTAEIENLASANQLIQPCKVEPHHFQIEGTTCNTPALQGTMVGNSPINLLLEDPVGRRIGFDPITGNVVNDFGSLAEYSGSNSEPQVIVILPDALLRGNYRVTGVGTGDGAYSVSALVNGEDAGDLFADIEVGSGTASTGIPIAKVPPIDFFDATVRLSYERIENGLLLHWSAWTTNLTLEAATTLSPPSWLPALDVNYLEKNLMITNLSNGTGFFRLVGP